MMIRQNLNNNQVGFQKNPLKSLKKAAASASQSVKKALAVDPEIEKETQAIRKHSSDLLHGRIKPRILLDA